MSKYCALKCDVIKKNEVNVECIKNCVNNFKKNFDLYFNKWINIQLNKYIVLYMIKLWNQSLYFS